MSDLSNRYFQNWDSSKRQKKSQNALQPTELVLQNYSEVYCTDGEAEGIPSAEGNLNLKVTTKTLENTIKMK